MKTKRILASLLAVTVVGASMPAVSVNMPKISMSANAQEATSTDPAHESYLQYKTLDDGTIEITGCDKTITKAEIPAEINGIKVTSISGSAFRDCSGLTEITIPANITSIGGYAFSDTPWLENKQKENSLVIVNGILIDGKTCSGDIVIPDSVTSISDMAFNNCSALTSITIPDSVTSIGTMSFYGCSVLTSITILNTKCEIDDSVRTICNDANSTYSGVIKGYSGSTAEEYAKKYNREFESLGEAPAPAIVKGDINDDNTIDSKDATLVLVEYSLTSTGGTSVLTDSQKSSADINKDGKIDSVDASFILQFYSYVSTGGTETDISKWMNN